MRLRRGFPLLLALACTRAPEPPSAPPEPAPAPEPALAVVDAAAPAEPSAPPAPAGPSPIVPRVTTATAVEPTGLRVGLVAGEESVTDPAARFELVLAGAFRDARLTLLDAADAVVEASGTQEVGATTHLTLVPTAPLVPAGKYQLRLDGATTRELHDALGASYLPTSYHVLVAGQPPPPAPKATRQKKRH